jgi:5-methyltetrahydrofolate--homocysteine methyltransferase
MTFRQELASGRVLLLDGAMGTMLQKAGMPAGVSPEMFCLANPALLRTIHKAYLNAGVNIITSCTFGGNPHKLPKNADVFSVNKELVEIARQARREVGTRCFVAGNVGPTGQFIKPLGEIGPQECIDAFARQIRGLVAGGADLIFIETQFDLAEAKAAVVAARRECDLPVMVSMTFEQNLSLTGSTPAVFAETMQNMGVDVIGTNCSAGPAQMLPVIEEMLSVCSCPVLAEPNAGLPELRGTETVFPLGPEEFARQTATLAAKGARVLGGCCGTAPEHLTALLRAVRHIHNECVPAVPRAAVSLTSRSHLVRIGADEPLVVIGERINPTGKKILTRELREGCFTTVLQLADEQAAAGARVLDVNAGVSPADEAVLLPELVRLLSARLPHPLSLDSSNADALAAALPWCPGSFLVNSVSGEQGRMEALGPLCKNFGSPFILLPLKGTALPRKAAERIRIIEELMLQAEKLDIPKRLILVDILALTVSSAADGGKECLEMARWCRREGLPTTIGLSNISFGLPARDLLNATFLSLAVGAGLNSCIANPSAPRVREATEAIAVLNGDDKDAAAFITSYAAWKHEGGRTGNTGRTRASANLYEAVLNGDRENVLDFLKAELTDGTKPFLLMQNALLPAITEVGARYERREYFLPQLIRSAETMQTAFAHLKPLLENQQSAKIRHVVIMATVEGDIHDIGKNIVALLLGNHGFEVIDAGKDVSAEVIVSCAVRHNARIIGLSALMTTTMVRMEDTIRLVRERTLPIRIMVGGAAVTQAFAEAIGADAYAVDAVGAVRAAKNLLQA